MDPRPALENCAALTSNARPTTSEERITRRFTKSTVPIGSVIAAIGSVGKNSVSAKAPLCLTARCSEAQAGPVIEHLDSACGLNTIARLAGVARDIVRRLVRVGGQVAKCMTNASVNGRPKHSSLMKSGRMWARNNVQSAMTRTRWSLGILGCQRAGFPHQSVGNASARPTHDGDDSLDGSRPRAYLAPEAGLSA